MEEYGGEIEVEVEVDDGSQPRSTARLLRFDPKFRSAHRTLTSTPLVSFELGDDGDDGIE